MEQSAHQWDTNAKNKAERVLNAALSTSKDLLSETLRESAQEITQELRREIQKTIGIHIEKPLQDARNLVLLIISAGAIVSAIFMLVGLFLG